MMESGCNRRQVLVAAALAAAGPLAAQPATRLTVLSGMAGPDIAAGIRRQAEAGLRWLDLKDELFGQPIDTLRLDDARRIAALARDHGMGIASLSTALCATDIGEGEAAFTRRHHATLDHVLRLAEVLQPRSIRLLSAVLKPFPGNDRVMDVVERDHPWVFGAYARLVDRIDAAGSQALIENEPASMILTRPEGILRFFERLERPRARYTWDVQNLWQVGVFPTLDIYRQLQPVIGCLHLKGGAGGRELLQASALEDASWPVLDIVRAAVADGVAPFLCLNPSHGRKPPGFDIWQVAQRDIAFLRRHVDPTL